MPPKFKEDVVQPQTPTGDEPSEEVNPGGLAEGEENNGEGGSGDGADNKGNAEGAAEVARLREEVAALKAREEARKEREQEDRERASKNTGPTITSYQLEAMTDAERENVEKVTGMDFATVVRRVRAQEQAKSEAERVSMTAESNVRAAIDDLIEENPQAIKLKKHIREYMADISDADKADRAKLKRHIERAFTYAKGKEGVTTARPAGRENGIRRGDNPDGGGEGDGNARKDKFLDDVKPGVYQFGDFRLRIEDLPPEVKKRVEKSEHPNGIKIGASDWNAPRFNRG